MTPALLISRLPEPLSEELQAVLPMLRRLIRRVSGTTGEEADDVLQELLAGALAAAPRFQHKCKLSTFFAAVMRNRAKEMCRRRREVLSNPKEPKSPLLSPELLIVIHSFAEDVETNWPPHVCRGIRRALLSKRTDVHFSAWIRMYGGEWR